jgi:hypothetical protein
MMMTKDPSERYQNASDLLHDLQLVSEGHPPHFARKHLDLSEVATSIATDVIRSAPVVVQKLPAKPSLFDSPLFMVIMVMLGISALVNIILAVLLTR